MDEKSMQQLPCEGKQYNSMTLQNRSLAVEVFRVLQSLRKDELLCDFKMETDDGRIIHGHKVILASASPYFLAMFTNVNEKDKEHIYMKSLEYTSLELIINYIYTGKISSLELEVFTVLQSLRKDELLCDIKMETDDGRIVLGHKVVLASASPYFLAMFTNFNEKDKEHIYMKSLEYTSLELIINYIYTGKIIVNEENVLDLLAAANYLSIDYVKDKCTAFLGRQLDPFNGIGIYRFADLHNCTELKACSEAYIKTQFLEVVKYDDFLCLCPEELIKIICSNDLNAPLEQNVFETVINWVQHKFDSRKQYIKNLLAHVRLPLIPTEYLLNNVVGHPLIEISPECKDYVNYALHFNFIKTLQKITIPHKICCTRRSGNLNKIILRLRWGLKNNYIYWYDPATTKWKITSKIRQNLHGTGRIISMKNQFVIIVQGDCIRSKILDLCLAEPCWITIPHMTINGSEFGVALINNCVYVVGGMDSCSDSIVNSLLAFDINLQEWRRVASMSSKRSYPGVGVLNNLLYAVGGHDYSSKSMFLKSVECYDPRLDTWKNVAEISEGRSGVSIGVLDGIIYAIGGYKGSGYCKTVEAYKPSDGFWTRMADLHLARMNPEVVTLHGLIYVMDGMQDKKHNNSVEIYNPKTNTWKSIESPIKGRGTYSAAVVIDRPPYL